jgi:Fe2+ or Zn2+ uptake regulation protein
MVGSKADGTPDDLLFPEEYQVLRTSSEECVEQLHRQAAKRNIFPQRHRDILELLVTSPTPLTLLDLAEQLPAADAATLTKSRVGHSLRVLKQRDLVCKVAGRGREAASWEATEAGRRFAAEHRAEWKRQRQQ